MPQASHQTDARAATAVSDPWAIAVVARQGQPPLRFRGRRCAQSDHQVSSRCKLSITLWARRKGDVVLAYTEVSTGSPQPQAMVFQEQLQAVEYLEALCAEVPGGTCQTGVPIGIPQMFQALALQQYFTVLVGDFLASLDDLNARGPHDSFATEV